MLGRRLAALAMFILFLMAPDFCLAKSPLLPTPKGLEKDVIFWERIFTEYTPHQCLFHDKDDLSIIYGMADLPKGSRNFQSKAGRRYVKVLQRILRDFSAGDVARTKLEKQVYAAIPKSYRTKSFFREAAQNIRCQRGVDLRPSLNRSAKHLRIVKTILGRHNLPTDLAYLPHLESGYDANALSRAGARGIWQLMKPTARLNGMRITNYYDPRSDPRQSTEVAARILKNVHTSTSSWPLTVTAYNYGSNGIARAIKIYGPDYMKIRKHHQTSIFGFAAKNYYPSFLAARNIVMRLENAGQLPGSSLALEDSKETKL